MRRSKMVHALCKAGMTHSERRLSADKSNALYDARKKCKKKTHGISFVVFFFSRINSQGPLFNASTSSQQENLLNLCAAADCSQPKQEKIN